MFSGLGKRFVGGGSFPEMKAKLKSRITPVSWIPFSELNDGTPSLLTDFHRALSAFSRDPMLRLCATMNNLMYGLKADFDPGEIGRASCRERV